jgi:hypothetical protein
MKLNALKFGLAAGLFWGISLFLFTLLAIETGYAEDFLKLLSTVYLGYEISIKGACLGLVWGFADGFIGCWIFASIYNLFLKK